MNKTQLVDAVVAAAAAVGGLGGVGQTADLLQRKHGACLSAVAFFCNQCRAESAHDAGNIGANGL